MGLMAFGFEHLPQDYSYGTPTKGYGLSALGWDIQSYWGSGNDSTGNLATLRVKNGYIQAGDKTGVLTQCAGKNTIPFSSFIGVGTQPNKVIIGFRCTRFTTIAETVPIFSVSTDRESAQPYAGLLPAVMYAPADALNAPKYYEVEIDLVARTWKVFTDNVQTSTGAVDAGITKANFSTRFWQIGAIDRYWYPANLAEGVTLFGIKDIYINWSTDAEGDTVADRLGPITVVRVPPKADNEAPWPISGVAASRAAALAALRPTSDNLTTPMIATDQDKTPLSVTLDTTVLPAGIVKGLTVSFSACTNGSTPVAVQGKLTFAGNSSTGVSVTPANVLPVVDTFIGNFKTLPGGAALSKANLATTEIVLTPS